uniref:Peptidoglycan L-alanyl-D-glutamate endopeptidase CwlK n=1 Tax=Candidatus Kentrum sp. LFY TaxID=2126342 RepID=A0A450WC15_9GAMM|nr:MAG: peptidoglycan L-alanyl-D-glutamate endopeptidase CwlK [Candidatus Kentron sp. LFY]
MGEINGFGGDMSGYRLGLRSRTRLIGVHPDLVKVVKHAIKITEVDFTVLEGVRKCARQKALYDAGASKTMSSYHLIQSETGKAHAVDLGAYVDGRVRWDWPMYDKLGDAMKKAAQEVGVALTWGGDWSSFKDGPHFQIEILGEA